MHLRLVIRRSRVRSLPGLVTVLRGSHSYNIFYGHSFPSADSRRAVVKFRRKNRHTYWLNAQRAKSAKEKVWLGKLTALDITLMDWQGGRKTSTHTNKEIKSEKKKPNMLSYVAFALRDLKLKATIEFEWSWSLRTTFLPPSPSHTHTRTHARTHARTHTHKKKKNKKKNMDT